MLASEQAVKQLELMALGEEPTEMDPGAYAYWRQRLLKLEPGDRTRLNGVPVMRIPCSGASFRVGVWESCPDNYEQVLRLDAATIRVWSGYYPSYFTGPLRPRRQRCGHCQADKHDRWAGAFSWCMECVEPVCLDCWNAHREWHEAQGAEAMR
jgi:hypothetical protein